MRFPLVGSALLLSLFLAFKFLPKDLVNLVLSGTRARGASPPLLLRVVVYLCCSILFMLQIQLGLTHPPCHRSLLRPHRHARPRRVLRAAPRARRPAPPRRDALRRAPARAPAPRPPRGPRARCHAPGAGALPPSRRLLRLVLVRAPLGGQQRARPRLLPPGRGAPQLRVGPERGHPPRGAVCLRRLLGALELGWLGGDVVWSWVGWF